MGRQEFDEALNNACIAELGSTGFRGHLGASGLGSGCLRSAWYSYRWSTAPAHGSGSGQLLRLFSRGHEEEFRVARWLRAMGIEVRDYTKKLLKDKEDGGFFAIEWAEDIGSSEDVSTDPKALATAQAAGIIEQWGFKKHGGHYGGSADGVVFGVDKYYPEAVGAGLLEIKTANDKNFNLMKKSGVRKSKFQHFYQMQQYMYQLDLPWALYLMVCKSNDEIYTEIVHMEKEHGARAEEDALKLIEAGTPPPKIRDDPSFWVCRFCDHREVCHYGLVPAKNCRTCKYAAPDTMTGGQAWKCRKFEKPIPKDFQPLGCDYWVS